jgi:hypothetical protein
MINYELGLLIAIFSFVYSNILTEGEMILNPLYNWLDCKLNKGCNNVEFHWLFKVLIHCEKCISGQLALWLYFFYNFYDYVFNFSPELILYHFFFITFAILCTITIKGIYNKHIRNE